jgi:hypothetical protein
MSQQIPPPKKMVSRNVAIALGIICILLGSLGYFAVNLQNQVNDLNRNLNLDKSVVWINEIVSQPARSFSYLQDGTFVADYCGYVVVWVTSTSKNIFIQAIFEQSWITYDQVFNITSGTGYGAFAVIPCHNIEITVGNYNLVDGATENVTVTYYY